MVKRMFRVQLMHLLTRAGASRHERPTGARRSRQRGFSLLTVFMLMALMITTAGMMLWTTQGGIAVTGIGREQTLALEAAEYSVARAKALISSQSPALFNSTTGWTPLLTSSSTAITDVLCANAAGNTATAPGTTVKTATNPWNNLFVDASGIQIVGAAAAQWRFCIHNNADDPHYLDTVGNTPPNVANGEINDQRDPQHLLAIEGYGTGPNGAAAHVTVLVGTPTLSAPTGGGDSYAQEGGGATHSGSAGTSESGTTVTSGSVTF